MAKHVRPGDTIIGKHTDGHSRRCDWKGQKKHPILKKRMTLYECSQNTYAEIVKECNIDDLNDECRTKFYYNLGDNVNASSVSIYVDSIYKYSFKVEAGISGRHKAQTFSFRNLAVCTITIPLSNLEKSLKQKEFIEQQKQIEQ